MTSMIWNMLHRKQRRADELKFKLITDMAARLERDQDREMMRRYTESNYAVAEAINNLAKAVGSKRK